MQAKAQGVLNPKIASGSKADFPIEIIRATLPALNRTPGFIFFDNAAGAQVPQIVLDAVNHHLLECNVQRGGGATRKAVKWTRQFCVLARVSLIS